MSFAWGSLTGDEFCRKMDWAYDCVVQWRRNLFMPPSGKAGKELVAEITRLITGFAERSELGCVALKACFVLQALVLQKPSGTRGSKCFAELLRRRLVLWKAGDIDLLVAEGRALQLRLPAWRTPPDHDEHARKIFTRLMLQGKVKAALHGSPKTAVVACFPSVMTPRKPLKISILLQVSLLRMSCFRALWIMSTLSSLRSSLPKQCSQPHSVSRALLDHLVLMRMLGADFVYHLVVLQPHSVVLLQL